MGMILRIASSRIVGQGDIVGRSGYFSLNLSATTVMRGRLDARRTLKSLVADLRIKGNVGFFIVTIDFIGYTGTVLVLMFKEFAHVDINWLEFYNILSGYVGLICTVAFTCSMIYLIQRYKKEKQLKKAKEAEMSNGIKFTGEGMEPTTFSQI